MTEEPAEKVIASGTVNIYQGNLNVREGAGTHCTMIGAVPKGSRVEIYEITTVDGVQWGRIAEGWISMDYVLLDQEGNADKSDTITGLITLNYGGLNIREGAGGKYQVVGYLTGGTVVSIYETKIVGSSTWGRIDQGWISMDYVRIMADNKTESVPEKDPAPGADEKTEPETEPVTKPETKPETETAPVPDNNTTPENAQGVRGGVVNNRDGVNLRADAGTHNEKIGALSNGTRVTVTKMVLVNGVAWGQTERGWVSLDYVTLDPVSSGSLVMITASSLSIRRGAGVTNAWLGSYTKGTLVVVEETTQVGETTWGQTDLGWISLDFVK